MSVVILRPLPCTEWHLSMHVTGFAGNQDMKRENL